MRFGELIFLLIFVGVGLINLIARLIMSNARKKKQALSAKTQAPSPGAKETKAVEQPAGRGASDAGEVEIVSRTESLRILEEGRRKIQEAIFREKESREEVSVEEGSIMDMSAMNREIQKPIVREKTALTYRASPAPPTQKGKTTSGWQKINRLPPLKRAVILSEILGKPKGMDR